MLPRLIQGGMGVGVSGWPLARAVAAMGQLGVVSGTALDTIMIRRLALGDVGGHVRRAIAAFPVARVGRAVVERYFREAGYCGDTRTETACDESSLLNEASDPGDAAAPNDSSRRKSLFDLLALPRARLTRDREWLLILANFVEVFLAKEGIASQVLSATREPVGATASASDVACETGRDSGHCDASNTHGAVGINYLHKIQFPTLPSLYGAMLAGVDVVLMGAGIPGDIPAVLDRLSQNLQASITLDVLDAGEAKHVLSFDPMALWRAEGIETGPVLRRPKFLAIVSSATLARALLKKAPGGIDGFVVEAPIAGGHNAPPRGPLSLSVRGEPIYGERDIVDFAQMVNLGVPFWLAGGCATRDKVIEAMSLGAHGVQVGTAFAFCEESGLDPDLRRSFLARVLQGEGDVFTDPAASPTSFPFKVAALDETLSDAAVYEQRPRLCDLGYLRRAYARGDGTIGYRCPGEPIEEYVKKGGTIEDTVGRKCLCNGLLANVGLGQHRGDGYVEPALLTAGDDLDCLKGYITPDRLSYHASDVVERLVPSAHGASAAEHLIASPVA